MVHNHEQVGENGAGVTVSEPGDAAADRPGLGAPADELVAAGTVGWFVGRIVDLGELNPTVEVAREDRGRLVARSRV